MPSRFLKTLNKTLWQLFCPHSFWLYGQVVASWYRRTCHCNWWVKGYIWSPSSSIACLISSSWLRAVYQTTPVPLLSQQRRFLCHLQVFTSSGEHSSHQWPCPGSLSRELSILTSTIQLLPPEDTMLIEANRGSPFDFTSLFVGSNKFNFHSKLIKSKIKINWSEEFVAVLCCISYGFFCPAQSMELPLLPHIAGKPYVQCISFAALELLNATLLPEPLPAALSLCAL